MRTPTAYEAAIQLIAAATASDDITSRVIYTARARTAFDAAQRDHEALRLLIVGVEAEIRRLHAPTKQLEIPGSK